MIIYLAPIQGFTDFVYRKAYAAVFSHIDAFFIPYISVKNNTILPKHKRETVLYNNAQKRVIPQVLVKNTDEFLFLSAFLKTAGYNEVNLNLGCPYPMVTKRGKGAGLLNNTYEIEKMLDSFFTQTSLKLSVKLRAGLTSSNEIKAVVPLLNRYPLTEVILHPRIAGQLYKGAINEWTFRFAVENLKKKPVYNGDIFSVETFKKRKLLFPETEKWMLGRGVLMNPFLPAEIKNCSFTHEERTTKLKEFHRLMYEGYGETMDNLGNVINKMTQFWSYFSYSFPNQKKVFKAVKKAKGEESYNEAVRKAFYSLNSI